MGDNWTEVQARCSTCNGVGVYHGSPGEQSPCPECNGEGYVDTRMRVKTKSIIDKLNEIWNKVKDL